MAKHCKHCLWSGLVKSFFILILCIYIENPCVTHECVSPGICEAHENYKAKCKCPPGYGGERCQFRKQNDFYCTKESLMLSLCIHDISNCII